MPTNSFVTHHFSAFDLTKNVSNYAPELGLEELPHRVARILGYRLNGAVWNTHAPDPDAAISAACVYAACHLMPQTDNISAKKIRNATGIQKKDFREAYQFVWADRARLVTTEMLEKGAKMYKLPIPKKATA